MLTKKPAIRHYAVISLCSRGVHSKIWEVRDRRSPDTTQYLLQPSFLIAWPRWVSVLGSSCTPVHLRNGKVALLIERGQELENLVANSFTKMFKRDFVLEPMIGFSESKRSVRKGLLLSIGISLIGLIAIITLFKPFEAGQTIPKRTFTQKVQHCGAGLVIGSEVPGNPKINASLNINNDEYEVLSLRRFGGLTQMKLQRKCDRKIVSIDSWRVKDFQRISKIY